ncbi:MAG TPA: TraR/DksA C4-type zinc finger protein, partial [Burkholderiaceae bacterium]|nr:TraR/DksA C4-type zinc finger protein [Burkholderiaceae bacterium]
MEVETQQHLTTLRQLLTYRMRELESERHAAAIERAESASEIDGAAVLDRKDEAEAEIREQAASRTEQHAFLDLQRCRAALQRLDDGVYGDCADCGQPVPLARLLVQPEAERCTRCQ